MPCEHADALALQRVPDIAGPIVVATEQHTTGDGEGDRCDTTKNVVVCEGVQFSVGSDIEKSARSIIGTRSEGIAVGEEAIATVSAVPN